MYFPFLLSVFYFTTVLVPCTGFGHPVSTPSHFNSTTLIKVSPVICIQYLCTFTINPCSLEIQTVFFAQFRGSRLRPATSGQVFTYSNIAYTAICSRPSPLLTDMDFNGLQNGCLNFLLQCKKTTKVEQGVGGSHRVTQN